MTDAEKKFLRSFLKEMEDELAFVTEEHDRHRATAQLSSITNFEIAHARNMAILYRSKRDMMERVIRGYKELFAEDLFPTCERCNLPVSDEDSAGPGSNLHMSCVKQPCDHADDCPLDYCEPLCPDRAKGEK